MEVRYQASIMNFYFSRCIDMPVSLNVNVLTTKAKTASLRHHSSRMLSSQMCLLESQHGLDIKGSLQTYVFEHLVTNQWFCLGILWYALCTSWRKGVTWKLQPSLSALSLSFSWSINKKANSFMLWLPKRPSIMTPSSLPYGDSPYPRKTWAATNPSSLQSHLPGVLPQQWGK